MDVHLLRNLQFGRQTCRELGTQMNCDLAAIMDDSPKSVELGPFKTSLKYPALEHCCVKRSPWTQQRLLLYHSSGNLFIWSELLAITIGHWRKKNSWRALRVSNVDSRGARGVAKGLLRSQKRENFTTKTNSQIALSVSIMIDLDWRLKKGVEIFFNLTALKRKTTQ